MAIPLQNIERQLEGVASAAPTQTRLPWPDEPERLDPGDARAFVTPTLLNQPSDISNPLLRPLHLSHTQISMAKTCLEQYRRRYILGQKQRPGSALIWGASDHKAAEHNLRQKIESHVDLPEGDVTDAFDQAWRDKIDEAGGESEVEWGDEKPAEQKDRAAQLVRVFHRQAAPMIQPVAVEEEFLLKLPGVEVPIKGYLDVREEGITLERKTAGKRQTLKSKPDWGLQGRIYTAHTRGPIAWLQSVKTKTPAVYTDGVGMPAPTDHQVAMLAKLVQRVDQSIDYCLAEYGPDEPWPDAISHPWACNYCGYRDTCAWWGS